MKKTIIFIFIFILIIFAMTACSGNNESFHEEASSASSETIDIESSLISDSASSDPASSEETASEEESNDDLSEPVDNNIDDHGSLSVIGRDLCDEKGNPVQLKGISSHGMSWFPEYINHEMLTQIKEEWGCNVFRLAMYTADYNGYCTGDENNRSVLIEYIDMAVNSSRELGLYLIIDWHILSDGNPNQYKQESIAFFNKIAEKYKNEKHIIYEICNEPNGGTTWEEIKRYAEEVIPVIRQYTDAVILVGTPNWSQYIGKAYDSPLDNFDNIMYTLHFYAATHKEDLRNNMLNFINSGLPVFVSEFGICDASGAGAIDEHEADLWLAAINKNNTSYVMWNLSNKAESSAMIRSDCNKTSNIEYSELSPAGKWLVDVLNKNG